MEKRKFGSTDMEFSVLGFGGAEIGYNESQTQDEVDRLLNSALDSGLNVIDTAAAYKTSEELIGKAVGHRRGDYYLLTKCGALEGSTRFDWTAGGIVKTVETSLKKLNTDHVDIVQLHSCDSETLQKGHAVEGLKRAREKGYTRFIGYSGDGIDARTAVELGAFDSLQTSVSVADQSAITGNIPIAVKKGLGVIAKRPIANAVWRHHSKPSDWYVQEYWERIQKLKFDFLDLPIEESVGIALRFTLSIPGISTAIVGTTRTERWQQNAEYVKQGPLDEETLGAIRAQWDQIADESWVGQV